VRQAQLSIGLLVFLMAAIEYNNKLCLNILKFHAETQKPQSSSEAFSR
jgi:hypothetical protein